MFNHKPRHTKLIVALMASVFAVAACGGSAPIVQSAAVEPVAQEVGAGEAATEEATPATGAVVRSTTTPIGEVLTSADGLTLYGFTNDVDAVSTCVGTCADAWPPIIVPADFTAGPGLDVGIFATAERDDGQLQLVAGRFPLYTFDGDAVPGDITGHGSGDVWFAIGTDGILYPADAPVVSDDVASGPIVDLGSTDLGDVLVDANGLSLYGFTNDVDGLPTCDDACADAWPPIIVESAELPEGLDPEIYSVVERNDGSFQLKAGIWPLYLFAGDAAPGDSNGQGSGDVWFLVTPDGGLIK